MLTPDRHVRSPSTLEKFVDHFSSFLFYTRRLHRVEQHEQHPTQI